MAGIAYAEPAALSPETQALLAKVPGRVNSIMMLAHAETCLEHVMALGRGLRQTKLDQRTKQIAILLTARIEKADYPWGHNVDISRRIGVPEWQIAAVGNGRIADPQFDETERRVLRFTAELVEHGAASPEALSSLAEKLSEREIVELILASTFHIMLARLTKTLQVEVDEAPHMK